ncbi:hypothetical protein PoB_007082100 [Plakobranchus ocellatus]|uniref:Uncharacterized protein n=1 Tax=Plakobranchus ocellatus TaxID=259542 RepID=A0AAV4DJG4_9GAST|nr:hypothetical protein PoB_007082100 [Plakobranchus ocellatus]
MYLRDMERYFCVSASRLIGRELSPLSLIPLMVSSSKSLLHTPFNSSCGLLVERFPCRSPWRRSLGIRSSSKRSTWMDPEHGHLFQQCVLAGASSSLQDCAF